MLLKGSLAIYSFRCTSTGLYEVTCHSTVNTNKYIFLYGSVWPILSKDNVTYCNIRYIWWTKLVEKISTTLECPLNWENVQWKALLIVKRAKLLDGFQWGRSPTSSCQVGSYCNLISLFNVYTKIHVDRGGVQIYMHICRYVSYNASSLQGVDELKLQLSNYDTLLLLWHKRMLLTTSCFLVDRMNQWYAPVPLVQYIR